MLFFQRIQYQYSRAQCAPFRSWSICLQMPAGIGLWTQSPPLLRHLLEHSRSQRRHFTPRRLLNQHRGPCPSLLCHQLECAVPVETVLRSRPSQVNNRLHNSCFYCQLIEAYRNIIMENNQIGLLLFSPLGRAEVILGKDGTNWVRIEPGSSAGRQPAANVLLEAAGPTPHAKRNINSKETALLCMIDHLMLEKIRECTVDEARRESGKASWDITINELKAFIALIYVRGAYGSKNIDVDSFWSKRWGNVFFSSTMSRNRFREIMRYLRFDKKETRRTRLTEDKFALVSEVWNSFIKNAIACYKPGPDITVDEQLFPTKSRCRFTQYMKNKVGLHYALTGIANSISVYVLL